MTNTNSRIVQLASAGDGRMGGQDLGGLPQGVAFEAHVVLKQHGWRMLAEYRHSPCERRQSPDGLRQRVPLGNGPIPNPIG